MSAAYPSMYARWLPITKSDTVDFEFGPPDAIYIGGAGVVVLVLTNGTTNTMTAIAGQTIPMANVKRINSTTTTATVMSALYKT